MKGLETRGSEFDRIARYFAPLAASFPGAFGLKDDAAVIAAADGAELVITTDTIVEGVHFIGTELPCQIAAKLLRVNLSDLAAMGARPKAYTLNIALPEIVDDAWLESFTQGLAEDQARFHITLIGGDSVGTRGPIVLTLTAIGEVEAGTALKRAGARAGDIVFVSGTIGDGALGLRAAQGKLDRLSASARAALIDRYRCPRPRVALGLQLLAIAHAAADISDGLVADLGHVTRASGVGASIRLDSIPLSAAAQSAFATDPSLNEIILAGGDDYELVFCVPPEKSDAIEALAQEIDLPLTAIGEVHSGSGVDVFDANGCTVTLSRHGFVHG